MTYKYKMIEARTAEELEREVNRAAETGWDWLATSVAMTTGPTAGGGTGVHALLVATMRATANEEMPAVDVHVARAGQRR